MKNQVTRICESLNDARNSNDPERYLSLVSDARVLMDTMIDMEAEQRTWGNHEDADQTAKMIQQLNKEMKI